MRFVVDVRLFRIAAFSAHHCFQSHASHSLQRCVSVSGPYRIAYHPTSVLTETGTFALPWPWRFLVCMSQAARLRRQPKLSTTISLFLCLTYITLQRSVLLPQLPLCERQGAINTGVLTCLAFGWNGHAKHSPAGSGGCIIKVHSAPKQYYLSPSSFLLFDWISLFRCHCRCSTLAPDILSSLLC